MNQVLLIGRTTKDVEIRYSGETPVAKFSLAVDRQGKDKQTDFLNIVAFGKTAELCEKYLAKGKKVAVQGRIQTGSYEKEGRKIYTTDVIAERIEFIEWGDKAEKPDIIPEGFAVLDDGDDPF